ncbi:MAG: chorismate-binding protein [Alphaproteobacteria bacterium]
MGQREFAARPVFNGKPGFALARFDAPGDGPVEVIEADIVVKGSALRFAGGARLNDTPSNDAQRALLDGAARTTTPVRAGMSGRTPAITDEATYHALVADAVAAIEAGRFAKVVTSRAEPRPLPPDTDLLDLFERLAKRYPAAFVALVTRPGRDAWLVATPETLLSWRGGELRTMALAGTQIRPDVADLATVTWVDKLIEEQAIVARDIRRAFSTCGVIDYVESGPRTVRAANLVHLRSEFVVPDVAPDLAARLLGALHPTAAVCGLPKAEAAAYLREREGYDRACYAGFLGPVNMDGGTDLFVNLRTSQIIGDTLFLYVGGGIVAGSDPATEWAETVAKTRTVGAVLDT